MRKEIILAIVLGVLLGVVIIFGINLANQSSSNTPTQPGNQTTPTTTVTPTPTPSLQVISPNNNSVSFEDTVTLVGKAKPESWVAIIWEENENIIQSDQTGNFSQEISLVGGENIIQLTATNGQDYQESTNITIIYTTAAINE